MGSRKDLEAQWCLRRESADGDGEVIYLAPPRRVVACPRDFSRNFPGLQIIPVVRSSASDRKPLQRLDLLLSILRITMATSSATQRTLLLRNTTLLPFLYQTRTILGQFPRRASAQRHIQVRRLNTVSEVASRRKPSRRSHEYQSSEPAPVYDVPFEGEEPVAFHQQRKSTITTTERQAFEALFKQYNADRKSKGAVLENVPDDLSDAAEDTLDSILDSAVSKWKMESEGGQSTASGPAPQARRQLMRDQAIIDVEENTSLRKAQKEQFEHVEQLMRKATSDVELWNVLEIEVLSVIRRLDLDAPEDSAKQTEGVVESDEGEAREESNSPSELDIIGPNYPSFLLIAMRQLRVDFPGSTRGLALLPAIKSLGRGSFALGASTELYNELLAMTWLIYSDFQGIDDLLQEMENGGIDFDANTLDLLDSIRRNALDVQSGRHGEGAGAVLEMDRFKRGLWRLQQWRDAIRLRMEAEAIRLAKENEVEV